MLARIIVGVWLIGFLASIGVDVFTDKKPPVLTSYTVVNKGQEYSYHKNNSTQINLLILKNAETGQIESRHVTVEAHWKSKVGDELKFAKNANFQRPQFMNYVEYSFISVVAIAIMTFFAMTFRWIFTGRFLFASWALL